MVFLAGGPGQGAAQLRAADSRLFRRVQRTRDIVLVDQRGTGRSNPLNCTAVSNTLAEAIEPDDAALARLERCLKGYDADVRFYSTNIAMDDLGRCAGYLGYDKVNLYGGSYGTRAALVYLRRHGEHVRSMILDGVAPTDMRLPLFTSRDAQRALDKMLGDCEAMPRCNQDVPGIAHACARCSNGSRRRRRACAWCTRAPASPKTSPSRRAIVASILFTALYSPTDRVDRAGAHRRRRAQRFPGLFALGSARDSDENMSLGMRFSVLLHGRRGPRECRETSRAETAARCSARICSARRSRRASSWPKGTSNRRSTIRSFPDVPRSCSQAMLDPVTPPTWGEEVVKHLSHGRHSRDARNRPRRHRDRAVLKLITEFIDQASSAGLERAASRGVRRPPVLRHARQDPGLAAGRAVRRLWLQRNDAATSLFASRVARLRRC
jgi:pimeloyl-ACP methyl ester carboxylesterase